MFAFRKIIDQKLYALAGADNTNVFEECLEKWNDRNYLYNFFTNQTEALAYYNLGKKEASKKVVFEAQLLEDKILSLLESPDSVNTLDEIIFTPLHLTDDFQTEFLQTKAYGKKEKPAFIRLYAIRLNDGCYLIVGGLIKTSRALQEMVEGKEVLQLLNDVSKFLSVNNYEDAYNIAELILKD